MVHAEQRVTINRPIEQVADLAAVGLFKLAGPILALGMKREFAAVLGMVKTLLESGVAAEVVTSRTGAE